MTSKRCIRVSDKDRKKQKEERAIFRKFVRSAGLELSIVAASIASRCPPQPDIYCVSASNSAYRFELCELADATMKQSKTDNQLTLESLVRNNNLNQTELECFDAKYDKCYVDLSRPSKKARVVLASIARFLLLPSVQPPAIGASSLQIEIRDIPGTLTQRGLVQVDAPMSSLKEPGSRWRVNSGGSFNDGVREAIRNKTDRTYSIRSVVVKPQLLLYYDRDPPYMESFPCEFDVSSLRDSWRTKFTDVWVFDADESRVIVHATAQHLISGVVTRDWQRSSRIPLVVSGTGGHHAAE
jgi:hypothetical protein